MKLILKVELTTQKRNGGNRGIIVMFTRTITMDLVAQNIVTLKQGYVLHETWNFKPTQLIAQDNETLIAFATCQIPLREYDSLEYYKSLRELGWIPQVHHANAIRCDGYTNFFPEVF